MNKFLRKTAVVVGGVVVSAGLVGAVATPADAAAAHGKDVVKQHRIHAVTSYRTDSSWGW